MISSLFHFIIHIVLLCYPFISFFLIICILYSSFALWCNSKNKKITKEPFPMKNSDENKVISEGSFHIKYSEENKIISKEPFHMKYSDENKIISKENAPVKNSDENKIFFKENVPKKNSGKNKIISEEPFPIKNPDENKIISKENVPIKKIEKKGKIENYTKIIINSKKHPEPDVQRYNYNTFCTFISIDDIFYLVYSKNGYDIVFYNLIDERKVIDIINDYFYYSYIIEIKHLFDENNERDLLFSLSNNFILRLWNVNNFECLFNIKIGLIIKNNWRYFYHNYMSFLKLKNKSYHIIVTNDDAVKIFNLNGKKINDDYREKLTKIEKFQNLTFIDTYYDKKLCDNFIFSYHSYKKALLVVDYQKEKLYQEYPQIYHDNKQIIINDDDEALIKLIYLINYDSIGIFNFHSGKLLYKINFTIIRSKNNFTDEYHCDIIYSLNYWNDNYISLSYGKIFQVVYAFGVDGISQYDTKCHSIEVINLKEEKMKQVLELKKVNELIFVKKISHPKYGDCLLTQDRSGEIKIIQIDLTEKEDLFSFQEWGPKIWNSIPLIIE